MDANSLFLQQRVQRAQSDCKLAIARMHTARTPADVARLTHITCEAFVRPLLRREMHEVQRAAELRIEEILKPELEKLKTLSGKEFEEQVGRVRKMQQSLRGGLARLYHQVDRAVAEAKHSQAKAAVAAPPAA